MGEEFQYADLIFLALVAAFVLLRLRSTLGRKIGFDGNGEDTTNRPRSLRNMLGSEIPSEERAALIQQQQEEEEREERAAVTTGVQGAAQEALAKIYAIDPHFSVREFLSGAKTAYDMVIEAFEKGDVSTLKILMSPEVFRGFEDAIEARATSETRTETTLVAIRSAQIVSVELKNTQVGLTVKFISEQIHLVRNRNGDIVEGDASNPETVEQEWVFERDTRSRDPNWMIVET